MKHRRLLLILLFLLVVWPVQGQKPNTASDYVNRGIDRENAGDLDGAIADVTKAIEIDPRYVQAYINRGYARERKGHLEGAIADYTKAIEINPRKAQAYDYRAHARKAREDLDGAIADYTKYLELEPRDWGGYDDLAWLLATTSNDRIRDGKRAVEYARKAAELTKWTWGHTLDVLAAACAEVGNFDEAIKWENKALTFPEFEKSAGDKARKRLQLYTERKPYHEPQPK